MPILSPTEVAPGNPPGRAEANALERLTAIDEVVQAVLVPNPGRWYKVAQFAKPSQASTVRREMEETYPQVEAATRKIPGMGHVVYAKFTLPVK